MAEAGSGRWHGGRRVRTAAVHHRLSGRRRVSRRRPPLRRLADVLAPDGPPAGLTEADLDAEVLDLAERQRVLPAVRSALSGAGVAVTGARLRTAHLRNTARTMALVDQASELLAAFDAAGVRAVPLKGMDAVLGELYPDWGARTMADLDVLVEEAAGPEAIALLAGLGYEPVGEELVGHHHLTPMRAPGRMGDVEVHVGLQDHRNVHFLDPQGFMDRASRVEGRPGLCLDRTDAAAHLVDHAQHTAGRRRLELDLRALHETALVIRRVPEVDWAEVRDRFDRAGQVRRVDAHLAAVAELFGVEAPVAPARSGTWIARRELFVEDHPLVGLVDRPGRRFAKLRRARLERYYRTTLTPTGVWRARARYLGEVAAHQWRHVTRRRRPGSADPPP